MRSSNAAHTPPGAATQFRASVFHPTRTGGSSITAATDVPEALTFQHIFGRGTLLTGETGEWEDLTPLSNSGASVTTTSVLANAAYTNGNYIITDPNGLKQKVKKFTSTTGGPPGQQVVTKTQNNWGVKVVSMSASITSLKVIWKHVRSPCASPLHRYCFLLSAMLTFSPATQPAATQSDRKLASEQMLRQLLTSLNASSTSRPQIDVVSLLPSHCFSLGFGAARLRHLSLTRLQGVSSLSLNSGSINLAFSTAKSLDLKLLQSVVSYSPAGQGSLESYTLPYLFQSIDTTTGPKALPVCETALVSALQYTDIGGTSGTHPNFPPFPLCRSITKTPAATGTQATAKDSSKQPNPAQASEGYVKEGKDMNTPVVWVTSDWTATITVPSTLVKTVSSGTLCCPPPPSVSALLLSFSPCLQRCPFCILFRAKRIVTFCVQIRRSDPSNGVGS